MSQQRHFLGAEAVELAARTLSSHPPASKIMWKNKYMVRENTNRVVMDNNNGIL
jgi:hypothetical protein